MLIEHFILLLILYLIFYHKYILILSDFWIFYFKINSIFFVKILSGILFNIFVYLDEIKILLFEKFFAKIMFIILAPK